MSALWTGEAFAEAVGGRPIGLLPKSVFGVSIDTRSLKAGEAFFAITGDRTDGHNFLTAAAAAGASVLVVGEGRLAAMGRITTPMIVVPDVLRALERLGAAARERGRAKVIAVTGSAGKTTTKEALRQALGTVGSVHAADKSFNNHWGVPLTLSRMPEACDYAVFEIGMNHPGEIRPLTKLVKPDIAIVTLIAAAHLGHFESLEEIADAKAEVFEGLAEGGAALINRDDAHYERLRAAAEKAGVRRILGFGEHASADYRLVSFTLAGDHSTASVSIRGEEIGLRVGAPGRHILQNALAVLGAADLAGADVLKAAEGLAEWQAERGRGQRHALPHPNGGTLTLIDESYNANPASMRAALALLAATPTAKNGRRIAVLGDMRELGKHSEGLHAGLAEAVLLARPDLVLLAGAEMTALARALPASIAVEHRASVEELQPILLDAASGGDVIMVKSSNGIGSSRLVDALVERFPAAPKPKARRA